MRRSSQEKRKRRRLGNYFQKFLEDNSESMLHFCVEKNPSLPLRTKRSYWMTSKRFKVL